MKTIFQIVLIIFSSFSYLNAQHIFKANIFDKSANIAISDVKLTIKESNKVEKSNFDGLVFFEDIGRDTIHILVSKKGYKKEAYFFILPHEKGLEIYLIPSSNSVAGDSTVIKVNKLEKSIEETPLPFQVLDYDIIEKKSFYNTNTLASILNGIAGLRIETNSQLMGNKKIRIHGFDGHYTQILKDGLPLYEDLSRVLNIEHIPILDIEQIEINKGGLINGTSGSFNAGTINLVSRKPKLRPEFEALVSQSHKGASTLETFYSKQNPKMGFSFHTFSHLQKLNDINEDDHSDFPETKRVSFSPKLYLNPNNKTEINFFLNGLVEERFGGNIESAKGIYNPWNQLFKKINTQKYSSQILFKKDFSKNKIVEIKSSLDYNKRKTGSEIGFGGVVDIDGYQFSTFSELNFIFNKKKIDWLIGGGLQSVNFSGKNTFGSKSSYSKFYKSLFAKANFKILPRLRIETSTKLVDVKKSDTGVGQFNTSIFFQYNRNLTFRLNGIIGQYETTSISLFESFFTINRSENRFDIESVKNLNFTIDYKKLLGNGLILKFNSSLFTTLLKSPFLENGYSYYGINALNNSNVREENVGIDVNFILEHGGFRTNISYSFLNSSIYNDGLELDKLFTPKHSIQLDFFYKKDNWEFGTLVSHFSSQNLLNSEISSPYLTLDLLAVYKIRKFKIFANFENTTNVQQYDWDIIIPSTVAKFEGDISRLVMPYQGFIFTLGAKYSIRS